MAALTTKCVLDIQKICINGRPATLSRLIHCMVSCQNQRAEGRGEGERHQRRQEDSEEGQKAGGFRVYEIEGLKRADTERRRKWENKKMPPPRFQNMPTDQDWTEVWPTASPFKWSKVPFPVRQGLIKSSSENDGIIPGKYANLELMKPPNFLHLTPPHVKKHCAAIKKFCTQWPEGLETDLDCRVHFPIESVTSDYVFAGPSIEDSRARVASIQFHLSDLDLDYHARDKFIRLCGERYDPDTDIVVFEADRCPLKSQNRDYVMFLLTAVYFESWKREAWEDQKQLQDMEKYIWDINASRKNLLSLLNTIKETDEKSSEPEKCLSYIPEELSEDTACALPEVQQYKTAIEDLFNEGENVQTINNYKASVKKLLNLKTEAAL